MNALHLFSIFLLVLTSTTKAIAVQEGSLALDAKIPAVSLRWDGNCRCPNIAFTHAVRNAYASVQAQLTWHGKIYRLSRTDPKLLIRSYKLRIMQRFSPSGPAVGSTIYAEAYDNVDLCGVRLVMGNTYLLNLANPWTRSAATHWPRGVFVLDACQTHYSWWKLNSWQKSFLWSRAV